MWNSLRICVIVSTMGILIICAGKSLAQQLSRSDRTIYSIDVMQDRADRLEVRLAAVEKIALDRGDRLARIETNLEMQGRIIWGLIMAAIGIGVDRIMAIKKGSS